MGGTVNLRASKYKNKRSLEAAAGGRTALPVQAGLSQAPRSSAAMFFTIEGGKPIGYFRKAWKIAKSSSRCRFTADP